MTIYYVSSTGNDSNPGTNALPFRTIQKGADVVNPGDTVIVKDGTYADNRNQYSIVDINKGGSISEPITFRSETPYGATLDGSAGIYSAFFWRGSYDYIKILDFNMTSFTSFAIINKSGDFIPTGGSHTIVKGNNFYNTGGYHEFDGATGTIIENNRFSIKDNYYASGEYAIYPGGQNLTIQNNVFTSPFHRWFVHIPPAAENIKIVNNTFNGMGSDPNEQGHIMLWGDHILNSILIQNNIFNNPRSAVIDCWNFTGYPATIKNNLCYGTDSWYSANCNSGMFTFNNNINTDPKFIDSLNHDFHLRSDSPAIGEGLMANAPLYDFDGNPRTGRNDIGAFQYVTPPVTPPGGTPPLTDEGWKALVAGVLLGLGIGMLMHGKGVK